MQKKWLFVWWHAAMSHSFTPGITQTAEAARFGTSGLSAQRRWSCTRRLGHLLTHAEDKRKLARRRPLKLAWRPPLAECPSLSHGSIRAREGGVPDPPRQRPLVVHNMSADDRPICDVCLRVSLQVDGRQAQRATSCRKHCPLQVSASVCNRCVRPPPSVNSRRGLLWPREAANARLLPCAPCCFESIVDRPWELHLVSHVAAAVAGELVGRKLLADNCNSLEAGGTCRE